MSRNLLVFSDGTGNRGGVTPDTNVRRLYNAIDLSSQQNLTFYDDGVGTQKLALIKALSGALGWGLGRNIKQLYTFLVKNYKIDDRIFLFGFSRGAYTVRSLLGMINRCGLVDIEGKSEAEIDNSINEVYRAYRLIDSKLANTLKQQNLSITINFMGVWDTVDAVAMPVDELKVIPDFLYGFFGKRAWGFSDKTINGAKHVRHALALDDERKTFHPNFSLKAGIADNNKQVDLKQVWFTGMHSNVGGSYPKDGLAYVSLDWMLAEMQMLLICPKILKHKDKEFHKMANPFDKIYDSRGGLAVYYRYSPRVLSRFPANENSSSGR